ncbi:lytic polysaccharide monooxygenase [Streptomyces sp. NPDC001137]|uniref:lytic polysaccharide monooxygenase auxiliary activity family 9 protein n=1 Tax=Streptomyces sp. NPDC001137 TaxID=3154378 RepID=UPI00331E3466
MPRMTAHRTALAAALVTPLLLPLWAAGTAQAHGAPTDPVSRAYACSPDGGSDAQSAACKAAVAANGAPFTFWDNLRVADVGGRDRQLIPDGKLCSGGLPAYKGLDLARSDWPSTTLKPGATLTMKYASTIPHTGTFKLYLTKPGYDPKKPLTWAELPNRPFASVKDPALTNGAYRITAKLPSDRTGHHVLYTIWQNSSTSDTYYSCSDVQFGTAGSGRSGGTPASASASAGGGRKSASSSPTATPGPRTTPSRTAAAAATPQKGSTEPDSTPVASTSTAGSGPSAPMLAGGAAAVLVLTGGAALALRLRRR